MGRSQLGQERIVEGYDGYILGNTKSFLHTHTLQPNSQEIVADDKGGGAVGLGKQLLQRGGAVGSQAFHFYYIILTDGKLMLQQRKLISCFAVGGIQEAAAAAHISNATMPHPIEVLRRLPSCQEVVIVDTDRLAGQRIGLADDDVQNPMLAQVFHNRIVPLGIQHDESVRLSGLMKRLDRAEDLRIIPAGDGCANDTLGVAYLPDAADRLQIEGVFECFTRGRRQDNADHSERGRDWLLCRNRLLIAKLQHGFTNPVACLLADRWIVVAYA